MQAPFRRARRLGTLIAVTSISTLLQISCLGTPAATGLFPGNVFNIF